MAVLIDRVFFRVLGRSLVWAVVVFVCAACGPRPNAIQAPQRPGGIIPVETVMGAGSDFRSFCFKWFDLPGLVKMADKEYTKQAVLDHFEKLKFNPAHFKLMESSNVRVYFIGEGSGYTDSLCVNIEGVGLEDGVPKLLFPNSNTKVQLDGAARLFRKRWIFGHWGFGRRSDAEPLLPGDFVDLGEVPAGKTLSFFLVVNGEQAYTPIAERNPDKKNHMVGMAVENTPYVLISYEDMLGLGDADFEDAVFAVEVSNGNVDALLGRFDPWGKVKRLAKWLALLAVVIGAPITALAARRGILRRRWVQYCQQAVDFLAVNQPSDALIAARKAGGNARSRGEKRRCQELILSASEGCNDWANLVQLYDTKPELFAQNEAASLTIGRAQIETGRLDAYGGLRSAWDRRETSAAAWLALDCDALVTRGRPGEAWDLLNRSRFTGPEDAARVARLACLLVEKSPDDAEHLAARAVHLNPGMADVHLLHAVVLEGRGKLKEAHNALVTALTVAPDDPISRDRLAGFYCRAGRVAAALEVWKKGLRPPSIDFIWSKFLFWSRVVAESPVDWKSLEPPPGELRPLIDYLIRLEPGRFWNAAKFNVIGKNHPALVDRQEVHWLRILESLRMRNETEARWLLSFERTGRESWHPQLGAALLRIVLYRQTDFLGPLQLEMKESLSPPVPQHPFFAELEQHAQGALGGLPESMAEFLRSDCVFAAVCFAAGWKQAGMLLAKNITIDSNTPAWTHEFWKFKTDTAE